MGGGIAWVVRGGEERLETGIELKRSDRPIGVLGVPAGYSSVVQGYGFERVGARRPRRIAAESIFEQLHAGQLVPVLIGPRSAGGRLPIGRNGIGQRRPLEGLELSELCCL